MARGTVFPLLLTVLPLLPVLFSISSTHPVRDPVPVKIALLHMYDGVPFFARLGKLTGENKARYAKRHGYDFIESTPLSTSGILKPVHCEHDTSAIVSGPDAKGLCWGQDIDFDIDHQRAPTFGKIKLALASCRGRDDAWLLWTDADAMVINQTIPLETLIDDGYDFMLAYDWLMLNAGMLLIKCSEWSTAFLNTVYNARKYDAARALDQSSFQDHIDHLSDADRHSHIKVVPKYAMNVYAEEYRPGDFLLHMAGKLYEATEPGLLAIAHQYDILSMTDDVEDVAAFFRGRYLLNYYSGVCPVKQGEHQSNCKPEDPRRIKLNESLGSMSYPDRYRHVGLRYYWLGDWKDKYDVPGWDMKRRALAYAPRRGDIEMPKPPPASLDQGGHDLRANPDAVTEKEASLQNNQRRPDTEQDLMELENPPERAHDSDFKKPVGAQVARNDNIGLHADTSEESDADDKGWPVYVWALLLSLFSLAVGWGTYALRMRKQKRSKLQ